MASAEVARRAGPQARMRLFWKKESRVVFIRAGSSEVTDKPVVSQRKMHLKSLLGLLNCRTEVVSCLCPSVAGSEVTDKLGASRPG